MKCRIGNNRIVVIRILKCSKGFPYHDEHYLVSELSTTTLSNNSIRRRVPLDCNLELSDEICLFFLDEMGIYIAKISICKMHE